MRLCGQQRSAHRGALPTTTSLPPSQAQLPLCPAEQILPRAVPGRPWYLRPGRGDKRAPGLGRQQAPPRSPDELNTTVPALPPSNNVAERLPSPDQTGARQTQAALPIFSSEGEAEGGRSCAFRSITLTAPINYLARYTHALHTHKYMRTRTQTHITQACAHIHTRPLSLDSEVTSTT